MADSPTLKIVDGKRLQAEHPDLARVALALLEEVVTESCIESLQLKILSEAAAGPCTGVSFGAATSAGLEVVVQDPNEASCLQCLLISTANRKWPKVREELEAARNSVLRRDVLRSGDDNPDDLPPEKSPAPTGSTSRSALETEDLLLSVQRALEEDRRRKERFADIERRTRDLRGELHELEVEGKALKEDRLTPAQLKKLANALRAAGILPGSS